MTLQDKIQEAEEKRKKILAILEEGGADLRIIATFLADISHHLYVANLIENEKLGPLGGMK